MKIIACPLFFFKMQGKKLKNLFRLRVGKYRIIFHIDGDQIKILDVDSREDIYK